MAPSPAHTQQQQQQEEEAKAGQPVKKPTVPAAAAGKASAAAVGKASRAASSAMPGLAPISSSRPAGGLSVHLPLPIAVACGMLVGAVAYVLQRRPSCYEVGGMVQHLCGHKGLGIYLI